MTQKQHIKHKHIFASFLCFSIVAMSMSLNTKHSYKLSVKRATTTRRRRQQQQQQQRRRRTTQSIGYCKSRRSFKPMIKSKSKSNKLSQKLQALKNLIPTHNGDIVKPDKLFQETAEYIVLLKTRVVILQKLIELYGNNNPENENALLL